MKKLMQERESELEAKCAAMEHQLKQHDLLRELWRSEAEDRHAIWGNETEERQRVTEACRRQYVVVSEREWTEKRQEMDARQKQEVWQRASTRGCRPG